MKSIYYHRFLHLFLPLTLLLTALSYYSLAAHAEDIKVKQKKFNHWIVREYMTSDRHETCIASSTPIATKYHNGIRNTPYFSITYKDQKFTVALYHGFTWETGIDIILTIGGKSHNLEAHREAYARSYSAISDAHIIDELLSNHENFTVSIVNGKELSARDYYQISGLLTAIRYIQKHC